MDSILKANFNALKSLLAVFLVLSGILIPLFFIKGETIFEDNFENYSLGNLGGQGDWSCSINLEVNNNFAHSGIKSITNYNSSSGQCERNGSTTESGLISIDFKLDESSPDFSYVNFSFYEDASARLHFQIIDDDLYFDWGQTQQTLLKENLTLSLWYMLTIQYDKVNHRVRARLDNEDWSEWIDTENTWDYINRIELVASKSGNANYPKIYIDDIKEGQFICGLGYCNLCEVYDTCIEAGCYWYTTIYPDPFFKGAYCVEPFEPEPEDCGSFFQCQYCMTQETCEAELNCEWVDKFGFGESCYMIEPTFPPELEIWQVPELEDCSALSGLEKWLCEIKNFIAGIFLPSQEKINNLYSTFGNFSTKFPFNYLQATKDFFSYIRESSTEEKGIKIKILGNEGYVNFDFWKSTGEVGSTTESIGSMVRDFSSLVLILGFLTWLLYFVRSFW